MSRATKLKILGFCCILAVGLTARFLPLQATNSNGPQNMGSVAVNPVTNKIYVAEFAAGKVMVIDGATGTSTTVANYTQTKPYAIAVNPVTNTIYVANFISPSGTVSVINGATDLVTATVTVGTNPTAIAVDPVTNFIYVANAGTGTSSFRRPPGFAGEA